MTKSGQWMLLKEENMQAKRPSLLQHNSQSYHDVYVTIRLENLLFHTSLQRFLTASKYPLEMFMSSTVITGVQRSTTAKNKEGQVNKLIEIQSLELYCDTPRKADDPKMENTHKSNSMEREELEDNNSSSILAPLDVSVSLSVNRSGKLLNDAPQYTVNVELASMNTSMDEVQLQQILSLLDYVSLCRLRESYGCYRPWSSPLGEKLMGWQKAWWHYAQDSVLSDVCRRLRRTSWKYFGERLNTRRKYVNLYKAKLKCLRHDQARWLYVVKECICIKC